ncbi:MAG: aa3-type cytochrome oxidase subunit IV [Thermoplasmata archaeon]
MKIEGRLFSGVAVFFFVVLLVYWYWSKEQSGTVMLLGTVLLGVLPGSYLLWWSRHMRPRPEDREDARIDEGAGYIGSFPDSSIWPFIIGLSMAMIGLAFVFGVWTAIIGGVLATGAVIGVVLESRRGGTV